MSGGGRPPLSVGIQPQIALYTVILGGVCAMAFYTERYRRDEEEIDGEIQKLYLRDVQDARSKTPQMTATIRGQDVRLDGRMNKLVWGGKAQISSEPADGEQRAGTVSSFGGVGFGGRMGGGFGGGGTGRSASEFDGDDDSKLTADDDDTVPIRKKKKKKKKRKQKEKNVDEEDAAMRQKLVTQSAVAGVAVGAMAVATISVLMYWSRR